MGDADMQPLMAGRSLWCLPVLQKAYKLIACRKTVFKPLSRYRLIDDLLGHENRCGHSLLRISLYNTHGYFCPPYQIVLNTNPCIFVDGSLKHWIEHRGITHPVSEVIQLSPLYCLTPNQFWRFYKRTPAAVRHQHYRVQTKAGRLRVSEVYNRVNIFQLGWSGCPPSLLDIGILDIKMFPVAEQAPDIGCGFPVGEPFESDLVRLLHYHNSYEFTSPLPLLLTGLNADIRDIQILYMGRAGFPVGTCHTI